MSPLRVRVKASKLLGFCGGRRLPKFGRRLYPMLPGDLSIGSLRGLGP